MTHLDTGAADTKDDGAEDRPTIVAPLHQEPQELPHEGDVRDVGEEEGEVSHRHGNCLLSCLESAYIHVHVYVYMECVVVCACVQCKTMYT